MFSNPQKNLLQVGISKGTVIVDLGCGAGYYSILAALMTGKEGVVYSVDINRDLVSKVAKEAKEKELQNVRPMFGDIEKIGGSNLADESADLVIMANVIFTLDNKKEALLEAKRIVKKKGRILFIEWSDSFGGIGPHSEHVFSETDAVKLFDEIELKNVQKIDAGEHHYGFVLRK